MSTIKANAVTGATTNSDLTLSGNGTGGVKVNDYFVQTKGSDIASATSLTLGKDGNQFDVTGTTTITSIATQGIGSYVTLHFDGALTFTHHSTDLVLPGAANITTAAGDIAVMYEYASGDWRCVSYTKASGAAVVAAAGGWEHIETVTASTSSTIELGEGVIAAGFDYAIRCIQVDNSVDLTAANSPRVQFGTGGTPTYQTSGYVGQRINAGATNVVGSASDVTAGCIISSGNSLGGTENTTETWDAWMEIADPATSARHRTWTNDGHENQSGGPEITIATYWRTTSEVITGFRILPGTGTFVTGTFILQRKAIA